MKCCCNSNRTQYERNRSLKYLVLALAWTDNGATLPLLGLWLNASKSETVLDTTISPPGIYRRITIASAYIPRAVLNELWNDDKFNILGDKSFADDLNLERGIVNSREALLPRAIEIQPLFFDLFLLSYGPFSFFRKNKAKRIPMWPEHPPTSKHQNHKTP